MSDQDRELRQLGLRVRELRRVRQLTTRELGELAQVSASMINQIETGRTGASVGSLRRVATALGVPLAEFFANGDGRRPRRHTASAAVDGRPESGPGAVAVVRRDRRKRLQLPESHVVYELLTPNLRWDIEFLLVELEPDHPPVESMAHPGQECAFVIAGTMHVVVGEDEYVLEQGDCICLDSSIPHRIENRGTETLIQLSAITPPSL